MKKLIAGAVLSILAVFLVGCGIPVTPEAHKVAEELCKNNGGYKYMYWSITGGSYVDCVNGAQFEGDDVEDAYTNYRSEKAK